MDRNLAADPVDAVNAYAAAQGWPFRGSSSLEFDRPELNILREVWFEKAAGRPLPYRSDFDARALKPVLPNLAIMQRVFNDGRWRYHIRLMGSALVHLMGEGTGRFLDEAIPARALPRWHALYDAAVDAGIPLRFIAQYEAHRIDYLVSESLQAPVLDPEGNPTMLLSCAYFQSKTSAPGMPTEP